MTSQSQDKEKTGIRQGTRKRQDKEKTGTRQRQNRHKRLLLKV